MPCADPQIPRGALANIDLNADQADEIEFPPVTRDHILNCSYDKWYPR